MTIYVMSHKKYDYPTPPDYKTVLVGAVKNGHVQGYLSDDTGDNISAKNPNYCELTGLYWVWKNVKNDDNVGLVHYRRYFSKYSNLGMHWRYALGRKIELLTDQTASEMLKDHDWIVATRRRLIAVDGSYSKSIYDQYKYGHNERDLLTVKQVIAEKYPEYLTAFDEIMQGETISSYNMFYTSRKNFDAYCAWLFDILFEVEKRIDISDYDTYQARVFGFLSERLLSVYLKHNNCRVKELGILSVDYMSRKHSLKEAALIMLGKEFN